MKKQFVLAVGMIFLCAGSVFAAQAGSTFVEEKGHWSLGFDYDRMLSKNLSPDSEVIESAKIKKGNFFYFKPSYGFYQNEKWKVAGFGKLGEGSLRIDSKDAATQLGEDVKYNHGFTWALGVRSQYQHNPVFGLAINAEYNQFHSDIDEVGFNGLRHISQSLEGDKDIHLSEFQTAVLFNFTIRSDEQDMVYRPYVGPVMTLTSIERGPISYRTSSAIRTNVDGDSSQENTFGVVIGLDVMTFVEALRLNFELRFVSESTFSLSIHYDF